MHCTYLLRNNNLNWEEAKTFLICFILVRDIDGIPPPQKKTQTKALIVYCFISSYIIIKKASKILGKKKNLLTDSNSSPFTTKHLFEEKLRRFFAVLVAAVTLSAYIFTVTYTFLRFLFLYLPIPMSRSVYLSLYFWNWGYFYKI